MLISPMRKPRLKDTKPTFSCPESGTALSWKDSCMSQPLDELAMRPSLRSVGLHLRWHLQGSLEWGVSPAREACVFCILWAWYKVPAPELCPGAFAEGQMRRWPCLTWGTQPPPQSTKASLQRTETNQQIPRSPTPPETRARLTRAQIRLLVGCGASNLPHWP